MLITIPMYGKCHILNKNPLGRMGKKKFVQVHTKAGKMTHKEPHYKNLHLILSNVFLFYCTKPSLTE